MTQRVTLEDRVRRWMRAAVSDAQLAVVRGSTSPLLDAAGEVQCTQLGEACAEGMELDLDDEDVADMLWDAAFDVHEEVERETRRRRSA